MANPFPAGALEVDPAHALAANMLAGYVPRAGNIIRDIVSSADRGILSGTVNYTYDSDGWLGGGGGNLAWDLYKVGLVDFSAARSYVIVVTQDPAAGAAAGQYWFATGAPIASVRMTISPDAYSGRIVDPFQFGDTTYASWAGATTDAGMVTGDQMAVLYRLTPGGPQTSALIVNAGAIQAQTGGLVNLATGVIDSAQLGPLGSTGKVRCMFAFNKIISDAEFTALVGNLGATARVIGGGGTDVTVPTLNGDPTIGVSTTTTIAVQWVAGYDAVGVTAAEISSDNGTTWIAANTVLGHTLTGLTPGQAYQIKYRLKDAALNTSVESAAVTGTALSGAVTVYARGSMTWPAGLTSPAYPTVGDQIRGMVFRGWHGGTTAGTAPTADYTTAAAVTVAIQTVTASGYTWQAQLSNAWSVGEKGFLDFSNRHGSQAISPTTHYHAGGEFTAAT